MKLRNWLCLWAGVMLVGAESLQADETVATVAGRKITLSELETSVKTQLSELDSQRFEILEQGLQRLITTELLEKEAASRKISLDELVKQEVESKVPEPSEESIVKLYEDNKDDFEGQSLDELRPQLVPYLKSQKMQERGAAYLAELRKKYPTQINLRPPTVEVSDGGRPARGKAGAPITIISFSDYECPFCKRGAATIEEVLKKYGDKIRYVHRDFPLDFHKNARPAAEACACAGDQGKYWEFHAKLWAAADLKPETLAGFAKELGLDDKKFAACVEKKPHGEMLDRDLADGKALGVNGTPAFFINGRLLSGAQPFEKFEEVIEAELARAAGSKS